jgi:dienelactone hydrolase
MRRVALSLTAPVLCLGLLFFIARDYLRGAAFVIQAAGMQGIARTVAEWEREPVTERLVQIPWRQGTLSGRWYQPSGSRERGILLVPGVHAAGIDEPRLIGFARDLASMGHPVVTAGLDDLAHYSITVRTTDMIEDAAVWLSGLRHFAPDGRIGMMGISFAGGLSIVAAGRPSLRDRVAFVLSFGGHGDLLRTLRYLCTGVQPDGSIRPPHDYGVAIILLGVADRVVPPEQVQPLRETILAFLEASRLDMVDKAKAQLEFEHARRLAGDLPEPAQTLAGYVNARDVQHLGPILLPHVSALGGDPALSPAKAPAPTCPVYLLHGTDDNVIPSIESSLLARELRARGLIVHQLATPLITHAEVDRTAAIAAVWKLVKFWGDGLDEEEGEKGKGRREKGQGRRDKGQGRNDSYPLSLVPSPFFSAAARFRAAISERVSSLNSPTASRSSWIGPIRTRRSRTTG